MRRTRGRTTDVDTKLDSSDKLIVVTEPATITLPDDPRTGHIVQVVTNKLAFPGSKVSIRGGRLPIEGGRIHLRENSIVTIEFTSDEIWVSKGPRAHTKERGEEGPRGHGGDRGHRGHRGEHGHRGHTGPAGAMGPTGASGAAGTAGAAGSTGATGPAGTVPPGSSTLIDSASLTSDRILTGVEQLIAQILVPLTTAEIITVFATFSASSIVAGTSANFYVKVNGFIVCGAVISFDGSGNGESGSISFQQTIFALPNPNVVELFAIANAPEGAGVTISPISKPAQEHATLTVIESF